jgi:hypothetical protein
MVATDIPCHSSVERAWCCYQQCWCLCESEPLDHEIVTSVLWEITRGHHARSHEIGSDPTAAPPQIVVVHQFDKELKRLVPGK